MNWYFNELMTHLINYFMVYYLIMALLVLHISQSVCPKMEKIHLLISILCLFCPKTKSKTASFFLPVEVAQSLTS